MIAAAFYRPPKPAATISPDIHHFVILIPAHNEALTLPATLETIKTLRTNDNHAPQIVVVADNCTDNTAELARQAGVTVYERHNTELRGKGHALRESIERLLDETQFEALVVLDADTIPDQAFLREAQHALHRGAEVIQGRYDVLKPNASWRTLLMYSAFVIYNHIRPLGRVTLGLSDGLRGNGMVFRREVLVNFPWQAFSLVEDIEYTTRLTLAGISVTYVPQAKIYGQAAATRQQATSQRMRWEGGRWAQAKQDVPRLLKWAIRKADWRAFDRAMDLIIPPLALLIIALSGLLGLNALLWWWLGETGLGTTLLGWVGLLIAMGLFVFGGLVVAHAPRQAYLALLFAPLYIVWKLGLYARMAVNRTPREWVRTPRAKIELSDQPTESSLEN